MERDARFDAMLAEIQRKRAAAIDAERSKLMAFKASGEAPFFDDVLGEMTALSRPRGSGGEPLTMRELYERACWANPDVRALLIERVRADMVKELRQRDAAIREEVVKMIRAGALGPKKRLMHHRKYYR